MTYNWRPKLGLNATNIPNPIASPSSTTIYTVEIKDSSGCVGFDTIKVTVSDINFNIGIEKKREACNVTPRITFMNKTSRVGKYLWNFGDGTTSDEASPSHAYESGWSISSEVAGLRRWINVYGIQFLRLG